MVARGKSRLAAGQAKAREGRDVRRLHTPGSSARSLLRAVDENLTPRGSFRGVREGLVLKDLWVTRAFSSGGLFFTVNLDASPKLDTVHRFFFCGIITLRPTLRV